jgi:hypothetical protein
MINLTFRHLMGAAAIAILSTLPALRAEESFVPTGIAEIDAMRRDFAANPTTPENASRRHALILSWVRLLVHRRMDMTDFRETCANFSQSRPIDHSRLRPRLHRLGQHSAVLLPRCDHRQTALDSQARQPGRGGDAVHLPQPRLCAGVGWLCACDGTSATAVCPPPVGRSSRLRL